MRWFYGKNGVLLVVKYGEMFTQCKGQCFMLEQDVLARNLTALLPENNKVRLISFTDLVDLTAQYSPQSPYSGRSFGNKSGNAITE